MGLTILSFLGCERIEKVSPIPDIKYKDFDVQLGKDSLGNELYVIQVVFSFIDGDGDIGLFLTGDPNQDSTNLFFITYQKTPEAEYLPTDDEQDTLVYVIAYDDAMERVGQNKTLKGEIFIDHIYYFLPDYDTIRYEFYMYDRARNQSNIETTEDIGLTLYKN
jgi:hypothetical protein